MDVLGALAHADACVLEGSLQGSIAQELLGDLATPLTSAPSSRTHPSLMISAPAGHSRPHGDGQQMRRGWTRREAAEEPAGRGPDEVVEI